MEYGTWQENRNGNLDWLQRAGELTDVNILVEGVSYPAHRVILAAHSEYFHRMFTCGMSESRNQDVKLQGMEPDVFQEVLGYIYCGRLVSTDIDILKGVYLAANMLQMSDLEHLTINKLGKNCTLSNCLDLYFFVESFCDLDLHANIFKKVKRILYELLSEHWGEMISQSNSATVSDRWVREPSLSNPILHILHFLVRQ
ncbi:kelch repeat and BTB domain-containing protein 12 [Eurytemora carolleeae]|uniref:kelch repeat and BTB domain-containing protein 12 n=1 Tax=Eurytemora carolleeae TaxID=1294199 RepID=UPI000C79019F|nr:kelch repeat and BTB domain-containing protein 12 [Eurytemora carolleeae]|eukprot:XP_023328402.1 kelch repeat and BTB domain-containing protein 12-like [Eurytemora affinis]